MKLKITVLPGDGIGPEVTTEAVRILQTLASLCGYDFRFQEKPIGGIAIRQCGSPLPPETLDACLESDAVLLGAVGGPEFDFLPANARPEAGLLQLRQALGGYANLRPAVSFSGLAECSPLRPEVAKGADVLIIRELLGGLYFGSPRGIESDSSAAFNTMRYSRDEVERVARIAFEEARRRRRKVTNVDKANVLETSQLWRKTVTQISHEFPDVKLEHLYVDACAMLLITTPNDFDVLLTENLFGDILSDEAAAITGSLGMLPSASIGGAVNLYEPVHGSAPTIAGRGVANPLGAIGSAALLLRYSAKLTRDADDLESAIRSVIAAGHRTADIARATRDHVLSTSEMSARVEEAFAETLDRRHAYHAV
jgi:3-isopropylmalate dehydrogenase